MIVMPGPTHVGEALHDAIDAMYVRREGELTSALHRTIYRDACAELKNVVTEVCAMSAPNRTERELLADEFERLIQAWMKPDLWWWQRAALGHVILVKLRYRLHNVTAALRGM